VKTKNSVPIASGPVGPHIQSQGSGRPSLSGNSSKPRTSDSMLIGSDAQVLAFSPPTTLDMDDLDEFNDPGLYKMTRAEWIMAQVDLDPIESHGSLEMSTQKFKTIGNGKRVLPNSERADSLSNSNPLNGKPPIDAKKQSSEKKRVK